MMVIRLSLIALAILMAGCGGSSDEDFVGLGPAAPNHICGDAMHNVTREYGDPEEIKKYDSGDYHSYDYWYWSQGVKYGFTWGSFVDGCEVDRYLFTPIR